MQMVSGGEKLYKKCQSLLSGKNEKNKNKKIKKIIHRFIARRVLKIKKWSVLKVFMSLRKQAYSNLLKISPIKTESFQIKNSDIFHISAQNIDCGYSLERVPTIYVFEKQ